MQSLRLSRAWVAGALLVLFALSAVASTPFRGRAFTGYYDYSGAKADGDLVQVTLHLKMFNHTDADVNSVIVTLLDSSPLMTLRGSFQPVKVWKTHQFIEMSQQFTITQREFAEWSRTPAQPNLVILYQDSKGQSWQKQAQLGRSPLATQ